MTALVILLVLLLLGPLALLAGRDSRERDIRNRQNWWPTERGNR
jgi:hypothetical protein